MATIAVFLSLTAAAGAVSRLTANSVRSKTIKNGQVKTVDLHDQAVTTAKLARNSVTSAQLAPDAVTGASVQDNSLTGADIDESTLKGLSSFDTIPSGTTVTGGWNIYDPSGTTADLQPAFGLPAPAPIPLTDANVNFGANSGGVTADIDPECTGDATTPTAPPGKVCIYVDNGSFNFDALSGQALRLNPGDPTSKVAFTIDTGDPNNNGNISGTWAYTAP